MNLGGNLILVWLVGAEVPKLGCQFINGDHSTPVYKNVGFLASSTQSVSLIWQSLGELTSQHGWLWGTEYHPDKGRLGNLLNKWSSSYQEDEIVWSTLTTFDFLFFVLKACSGQTSFHRTWGFCVRIIKWEMDPLKYEKQNFNFCSHPAILPIIIQFQLL